MMVKPELVDSKTLIQVGTLICDVARARIQDGFQEPEAAFLLKENRLILDLILQDKIEIDFRCSHIPMDDVLLIPLLIQFNENPNLIYETWFNFYQSGDVKKCFVYLAIQEFIRILLIDERDQPVDIIQVPNNLRLGFLDTLQRFKNRVPWSEDEFECAKAKLLQQYLDTGSLWTGLKKRLQPELKLRKNEVE